MKISYGKIPTEKLNPRAARLDRLSTSAAVRVMGRENLRVAQAVDRAAPAITRAVDLIARSMAAGGRLFFVGAGTSGRLGILEAAECPPTFDTPPALIQALMAGGKSSVFRSKEGAEDEGAEALSFVRRFVRAGDAVVGIAASGVTAFAGEALREARRRRARTVFVTCNPRAPKIADVVIIADTGPEVVAGSTRLKAGTATKMILNALTTLAMVRLGKTYGPYMVDLQPRSAKLKARALRLVSLLGRVTGPEAAALLPQAGGNAKTAILMARRRTTAAEARRLLRKAGGFLSRALGILLLTTAALRAEVRTGLDVMAARGFAELQGKRVGLICNRTAVDARGRHAADLLRSAPGVTLAALFAPEHGFSGLAAAGLKISSGTYDGVPVISLYGERLRPNDADLAGIDVLVFDMQDVGARFYTYLTTMAYSLEEASRRDIPFIVLDRPNPLGGTVVEGEPLAPDIRAFTAYLSVPVRHGMTAGEIAFCHRDRMGLTGQLTVIRMEGWRRGMDWDAAGLAWVPPSPNIKTPLSAFLYAGLGMFEATNFSVGRGTDRPFERMGSPWLDRDAFLKRLRSSGLPGFSFLAEDFVPGPGERDAGLPCRGVRVRVKDRARARPGDLFLHAFFALRDLHPDRFAPRWREVSLMTGTRRLEEAAAGGASPESLIAAVHAEADAFLSARKTHLLYE